MTVSGICPRLKPADIGEHIDAVNARLVSLCAEKGVTFADNTPSFTLRDGNVNDGYLTPSGVHITNTAINRYIIFTCKMKPFDGMCCLQKHMFEPEPLQLEDRLLDRLLKALGKGQ